MCDGTSSSCWEALPLNPTPSTLNPKSYIASPPFRPRWLIDSQRIPALAACFGTARGFGSRSELMSSSSCKHSTGILVACGSGKSELPFPQKKGSQVASSKALPIHTHSVQILRRLSTFPACEFLHPALLIVTVVPTPWTYLLTLVSGPPSPILLS